MLAAIKFDNHFRALTGKVDNVWADGSLSNEFETVEATVAQACPEPFFGFGCVAPQGSRAFRIVHYERF